METYWVPGVNALKSHGRWAFAEFRDVYMMEVDFAEKVEEQLGEIIEKQLGGGAGAMKVGTGQ